MVIDPAIVIAFIAALLGLLGLVLRMFINGALLSKAVVPREDYEALRAINAEYPEAIERVADAVNKLAASLKVVADEKHGT